MNRGTENLGSKRFGKEIECPLPHTLHGQLKRRHGSKKNYGNIWIGIEGSGEDIQTATVWHFLISQNCLKLVARNGLSRLLHAGRVKHQVSILLQVGSKDLVHVRLVVNDQNSAHMDPLDVSCQTATRGKVSVKRTCSGVFAGNSSEPVGWLAILCTTAKSLPVADNFEAKSPESYVLGARLPHC